MKRLSPILALAFIITACVSAEVRPYSADLDRLDEALERADEYVGIKEQKISTIENMLHSRGVTPLQQYHIYGELYKEYLPFQFDKAKEMLEYMGLAGRATHKPAELSGGEKQRVAVARALINRPAVILADEPSGSLDTQNKEELHQLFFDLREKLGQTFVIVTHDEELAKLTDRTIHMKDGRIID